MYTYHPLPPQAPSPYTHIYKRTTLRRLRHRPIRVQTIGVIKPYIGVVHPITSAQYIAPRPPPNPPFSTHLLSCPNASTRNRSIKPPRSLPPSNNRTSPSPPPPPPPSPSKRLHSLLGTKYCTNCTIPNPLHLASPPPPLCMRSLCPFPPPGFSLAGCLSVYDGTDDLS